MRMILRNLLALIILAACGCTTTPRDEKRPPDPSGRPDILGRVIRANPEHSYVLVECVSLPSDGEEGMVWRGERKVGRVRFAGPFDYPFATADVVDGEAMAGDRVKR